MSITGQTGPRGGPPYEQLSPVRVDFGLYSLQAAMHRLGPSFVYDVYVHDWMFTSANRGIKEWTASELSPVVNLHVRNDFARSEWMIQANGNSIGSLGMPI